MIQFLTALLWVLIGLWAFTVAGVAGNTVTLYVRDIPERHAGVALTVLVAALGIVTAWTELGALALVLFLLVAPAVGAGCAWVGTSKARARKGTR